MLYAPRIRRLLEKPGRNWKLQTRKARTHRVTKRRSELESGWWSRWSEFGEVTRFDGTDVRVMGEFTISIKIPFVRFVHVLLEI